MASLPTFWLILIVNVGKYTIDGSYRNGHMFNQLHIPFFISNSRAVLQFEGRFHKCIHKCILPVGQCFNRRKHRHIQLSTHLAPNEASRVLTWHIKHIDCEQLCMHACLHVCMHVCVYVCMHVCIYVSVYLCIYASMYQCIYVQHACMHACMHPCMHARTYVRTYVRT